jgi:hypothetical protein
MHYYLLSIINIDYDMCYYGIQFLDIYIISFAIGEDMCYGMLFINLLLFLLFHSYFHFFIYIYPSYSKKQNHSFYL